MNLTHPTNGPGWPGQGLLQGRSGAARAKRAPAAPSAAGYHYSGRRFRRAVAGVNGLLTSPKTSALGSEIGRGRFFGEG